MKTILLVGKKLVNIPKPEEIDAKGVSVHVASTLEEVKNVFKKVSNSVDVVVMGAGLPLETRLEVVRYVFDSSDATSVHMKDVATGPQGFLPFVNGILNGLIN